MTPDPVDATRSRSSPPEDPEPLTRPLGLVIICIVGFVGILLSFVPLLELARLGGRSAQLAVLLAATNVVQLVVLFGLWMLRSWAIPWAIVLFSGGLVLDLVVVDVSGIVTSTIVLLYIVRVSERFPA